MSIKAVDDRGVEIPTFVRVVAYPCPLVPYDCICAFCHGVGFKGLSEATCYECNGSGLTCKHSEQDHDQLVRDRDWMARRASH